MVEVTIKPKSEPKKKPAPVLTCWKLPMNPLRFTGAYFDHVGGGTAPLPAGRQSLQQPCDNQQSGRQHTDLAVGGESTNQEGRAGHQPNSSCQRGSPPCSIADPSEYDRPQGPRKCSHGQHSKCRKHRSQRFAAREEQFSDERSEVSVNAKVKPFQNVSNRADRHGFRNFLPLDCLACRSSAGFDLRI